MFKHVNLATEGLYPGLTTTRSIANLGHYETEVIIQPVVRSAGGGFSIPLPGIQPTHYRVTVRVKYKNKWYEDTQIVDEHRARVIAEYKGIKSFSTNNVMVSVNGVQIFEQEEITVKINSINTEIQSGIYKRSIQ